MFKLVASELVFKLLKRFYMRLRLASFFSALFLLHLISLEIISGSKISFPSREEASLDGTTRNHFFRKGQKNVPLLDFWFSINEGIFSLADC